MARTIQPEELALINKVRQLVGYVPDGMDDLLHILSHPEVRELTFDYLAAAEDGD